MDGTNSSAPKRLFKIILYVEDEMELAQMVMEGLRAAGFTVVHSAEYKDAALKAKNQRFDCIISDIRLLRGTGDNLILEIKQTPAHTNRNTPIIAVSSHFTKTLIAKIGVEISAAFAKPFELKELIKKLYELMGGP